MAPLLASVSPGYVSADGGDALSATGTFAPGTAYTLAVGGALCQSGIPGQATALYSLDGQTLTGYTPPLQKGLAVDVTVADGQGHAATLPGAVMGVAPFYGSETLALRSILPGLYDVGPRTLAALPPTGSPTPDAPPTRFAALTAALGAALDALGGMRLTRLAQAAQVGDTALVLERAWGLPVPGRLAIDGIPYTYDALAGATVSGVAHTRAGHLVPGVAAPHAQDSQVVDLSGTYSAIDQAKRAVFVDTAEGEDLSALGRNLGVLRLPSLQDDAPFRALIKALAYNPRGTLYGLQLVLDALVGPGHYRLEEDLVRAPCQIFVTVPGALFLTAQPFGKAYLSAPASEVATGTALVTAGPSTGIQSVALAAQSAFADTRGALLGAPWTFVPNAAAPQTGAPVTPRLAAAPANGGGQALTFAGATGFYRHAPGPAPAAAAAFACRVAFFDTGPFPGDGKSFGVRLHNGQQAVAWGCRPQAEGTQLEVGLIDPGTGAFLSPAPARLAYATFVTLRLQWDAGGAQSLWADGVRIDAAPSATSPTAEFAADIGALGDGPSPTVQVTFLGLDFAPGPELLNLTPGPDLTAALDHAAVLSASRATFLPEDDGKAVRIAQSQAHNAQGGNNNGTYVARYVDAAHLALTRPGILCDVGGAHATRLTAASATGAWVYPDDLGRQVTLGPSTQGNAGTYTIVRLLDPDRLTDLAAVPQSRPQATSVCEVAQASFVPEHNLWLHYADAAVPEADVSFVLVDAATHAQTASGQAEVTLRQNVPVPGAAYAVVEAPVPTAQVYATHAPFVAQGADGAWSAMPFYVSDPSNFVRDYLGGVVAAGVRLVFNFS